MPRPDSVVPPRLSRLLREPTLQFFAIAAILPMTNEAAQSLL